MKRWEERKDGIKTGVGKAVCIGGDPGGRQRVPDEWVG